MTNRWSESDRGPDLRSPILLRCPIHSPEIAGPGTEMNPRERTREFRLEVSGQHPPLTHQKCWNQRRCAIPWGGTGNESECKEASHAPKVKSQRRGPPVAHCNKTCSNEPKVEIHVDLGRHR